MSRERGAWDIWARWGGPARLARWGRATGPERWWRELSASGWLALAAAATVAWFAGSKDPGGAVQAPETLAPHALAEQDRSPDLSQARPERAQEPALPPIDQLSDLRHLPSRALGRPFRVVAVVQAVGGAWEPYLTRFDRAGWTRAVLWSDEARLWEPGPYADPGPFVFARRGTALASRLAALAPYDRVEIRGIVRDVVAGEPWIELLGVAPAGPGLTEAAVFHAARALRLEVEGPLSLARGELAKALAAPLPEHHRQALAQVGERLARADAENAGAPVSGRDVQLR